MTEPEPIKSSRIDDHIEQALCDADEGDIALVREALYDPRDRWYGQLVASVYDSLSDQQDLDSARLISQET